MASGSRLAGMVANSSATAAVLMTEEATASTALAPISTPTEGANPPTTEPAKKREVPNSSIRRRPNRSARTPAGTRVAAPTMVKILVTQDSVGSETPGKASASAGYPTVMMDRPMPVSEAAVTSAVSPVAGWRVIGWGAAGVVT